jgi:cytoskeletal protein RodZ
LKKSERKREEPKLGEPKQGEPKLGEPKLVEPEGAPEIAPEIAIAQEFQGESVSDTLIRARQQVGQDLRSIAEVLCIRYSYLDAIERGQYENLPGATYAVGFVRSYAEYLGLDGEQVVERFKSEVEGLDSQTKLHFPTPAPEGKMPGGAVFLVAALLFAGAYGVWFYLSNKGESLGDLVAPVPERLQELVDGDAPSATAENDGSVTVTPAPAAETSPAPAAAAPEPPTQSAALPAEEPAPDAPVMATPAEETPAPAESESAMQAPETPAAPAEEAPMASTAAEESAPAAAADSMVAQPGAPEAAPQAADVSGSAAESAPQVAVAAPEAAEAPEAPAAAGETPASDEPLAIPAAPDNGTPATAFLTNHEPQVYGAENADARIVLKATQDAWVQVRDRQGTLLLTRVLRVGDSYQVPNQDDLTLLTGNAGGLEILVDGRALAPLGPVGAVRRNIPLNPDSLLGGAAN